MKWLRAAFLICLIAVLQAGLANAFAVTSLNVKPDLLVVLMVFFAVFSATGDAIITSFVIGFAADIISTGLPMGPRTISFGLVGTLLANLHNVLEVRRVSHQAAAVFICCAMTGLLSHFLTFLAGHPPVQRAYIVIFATSLYSGIIAPFLFLPSAWLMRIKTGRLNRH